MRHPAGSVAPAARPGHVILNAMTVVGAVIACLGLGGSGFALIAGFLEQDPSAVKGILGYLVMPAVALAGVLLMLAGVLLGAWRDARMARLAGERPAVRIDVGGWRQLAGIAAFAAIAVGSLGVLGGTSYRAIQFTESTTFCGTCHTVMQPQVEAHLTSPHAVVECAQCHIAYRSGPVGPNLTAYVDSKINGLRQVYAVVTGTYDRPIVAPADKIPATNLTCEGCHAPDANYGIPIRQFTTYGSDEANSRQTRLLAFRVGGGSSNGGTPAIHWHATAKVDYRASDPQRQIISWVRVTRRDGTTEEWRNPHVALAAGLTGTPQRMTCIDCHNRVGHRIPGPGELIDQALEAGRIDRTLPYVKRESLALLSADGASPAQLALRFTKPGWFDGLATFYQQQYPDIAKSRQAAIRRAIDEMERISRQILYPDMNADWQTYPNNLGHTLSHGLASDVVDTSTGCFRCHGTLVSTSTGKQLAGTLGGQGCLACHSVGQAPGTAAPLDRSSDQACALCHVDVTNGSLALPPTPSPP